MKQKVANYSVVLLFFIIAFGLFQAKKQNRDPFKIMNYQAEIKQKSNQILIKNREFSELQVIQHDNTEKHEQNNWIEVDKKPNLILWINSFSRKNDKQTYK